MVREVNVQVLVLGSGPAGYSAAFRSTDLGLSTILIEQYNNIGGVCLNVGCIPSKFLLHLARIIKESKEIASQGVIFNDPIIDINRIREHKNKIVSNLSNGLKYMAKSRNVMILYGLGSFINNKIISVKNDNETVNVHFEHLIIATGSSSIQLNNLPIDNKYIWNSTQALSLKNIPRKLLIIGSGIIGLEMATFYSALGSTVDVIDRCNELLPFLDQDATNIFKKSIKNDFNILLDTHIDSMIINDNQVFVTFKNQSVKNKIYDAVLVAIGRVPNIKGLNLDAVGINTTSDNFIKVNNQFCTNIPNIYAIGDVIGPPMLAHKGIHQGHIVAEIISGYKHYFDPIAIPCVAYTDPEIAWVGINENEAKSRNINYEVAIFPWNASGRAIVSNSTNGITKLIINKDNHRIIGGIIVGRNAGELLSEITLAMEMNCDIEDISLTIHPHPTLSESIGLASQIFQGTITDLLNIKSKLKK